MFSKTTRDQIADINEWMDASNVQPGTESGHAESAARSVLALARAAGGDMAHVEEALAACIAREWHMSGHGEGRGMSPLFTEDEVPGATRVA